MPKQTFFNLPASKRNILIEAAKKEFSRVPLSEASIANIVKEADIPRGSFYQYFEDKEDLYFYLLNEHTKEKRKEIVHTLRRKNGDIFAAFTEMFHAMLQEIENESIRNYYRNAFLNMNYKTEKAFLNNMNINGFDKQYSDIKQLVNTNHLNVSNEEEVFHIVKIVGMVMMQNLVLKFAKNKPNEEVIKNYVTQINLLKKGFVKK